MFLGFVNTFKITNFIGTKNTFNPILFEKD